MLCEAICHNVVGTRRLVQFDMAGPGGQKAREPGDRGPEGQGARGQGPEGQGARGQGLGGQEAREPGDRG